MARHKLSTVEDEQWYLEKYGRICRHPSHMARVPLSEFHINTQNKDGLHSYCKKCRYKIRRAYWLRIKAKKKMAMTKIKK